MSQGHERGVGLEVFFKSIIQLPRSITSLIELHANSKHMSETAKHLNINIEFNEDNFIFHGIKVRYKEVFNTCDAPISTVSLCNILKVIEPSDILVTLPTSKDQLILNKKVCAGYTEFFRTYYNNRDISMLFHADSLDVLLLTDHIPLNEVIAKLSEETILNKITTSISGLTKYFIKPQDVIVAGVNPHAGEGGLLGNDDKVINNSIIKVRENFPLINFSDAIPGDTLHFHKKANKRQLFVYSFHDQGLPFFKEKFGLFGINVTMGLPFLRLSVDHGTAFNLYGKNEADCGGLLHLFYSAYKVLYK